MSNWLNIKQALREMLEQNEYVVFNNKEINHNVPRFIVIKSPGEINRDVNNYVGSCQYRNRRLVTLRVYNKNPLEIIDIDLVNEVSKDLHEEILHDLKGIFNGVYNIAGDAGAILLKYERMDFKDIGEQGIYSPIVMEVTYLIEYVEDRRIGKEEVLT